MIARVLSKFDLETRLLPVHLENSYFRGTKWRTFSPFCVVGSLNPSFAGCGFPRSPTAACIQCVMHGTLDNVRKRIVCFVMQMSHRAMISSGYMGNVHAFRGEV